MAAAFVRGLIEGFYGIPWSWQTRKNYASFMQKNGYDFYLYAPKADSILRQDWQQLYDADFLGQLQTLKQHYQTQKIQFGIGLSPYQIYLNYDETAQQKLDAKIQQLNSLNLDYLAILFDDMKGDLDQLAFLQIEILDRIRSTSNAKRFIMCPTYYTFDPILDRLFGKRPENYLSLLGKNLSAEIDIFWTGPKVCSTEYPAEHLLEVGEILKRKPFLWDNYPVNDGPKMSQLLHLKPFKGRTKHLEVSTNGHAVNPMNEAYLSQIPLATLHQIYRQEGPLSAADLWNKALNELLPVETQKLLDRDLILFSEKGLAQIEDSHKQELIAEYSKHNNPFAQEVTDWLKGVYKVEKFE